MTENLITQKNWYVILANKIHYKKAAAVLEKLGFCFYIPIQRQLHYWSDRKKWINVPILSPYIFLFTNEFDRKLLFQRTGFFHFLKRDGKLATVKEEEIKKIRLLCDYSADMKIENNSIRKGDLVEIIHGPFLGMNGYALQENGRHRFLVLIISLGQFASVEIDNNCVRLS